VKISLEWLSDHVDLPAESTPAQLAHELTLKTVEVEGYDEIDGDIVFEIDNKSLTNRPDLWGHYGIAREFAVIYGVPLKPLQSAPRPPASTGLVGKLDPGLCERFSAVRFTVDNSLPTPGVIRERLRRIGEQSVNLCVDLSNYVMFTVGQPNHVYDADGLGLPLSAVFATEPNELELLTGKGVAVPAGIPVVRDATGAIAAAGVMGGASPAARLESRNFVLETATFKPGPVRRSSRRLGLRSAASARYEKALDTQRVDQAVGLFLHLLFEVSPDARASAEQDVVIAATARVELDAGLGFIERRIGTRLFPDEINRTLRGLGFGTAVHDDVLHVSAPTWRSTGDISLPHDVVDELARMHGFDQLPSVRPVVSLNPVSTLNRKPLSRLVREQLTGRGGLSEVFTYPWAASHLLAACGFGEDDTVRVDGAPAPDRGRLRPTLIPNLLEAAAANLRYRTEFGLLEVGEVFAPGDRRTNPAKGEVLPSQRTALGIALAGTDGVALFRRAKGLLETVHRHCHLVELKLSGDTSAAWADPSARLAVRVGGAEVGALALVRPTVRRAAGIEDQNIACVELDLNALTTHTSRDNHYRQLSELPEPDFDLSVVVVDTAQWSQVAETVLQAHELVQRAEYIDEYRGTWVPEGHRSLTLKVTLRPREATLTASQISEVRDAVVAALEKRMGARLR
jgi:phenylalanyl-tRNA synthetase beta chain